MERDMTGQKSVKKPMDESDPEIAKIADLRREVSYLLTINNALVKQVWEIDRQLQNKFLDNTLQIDLQTHKTALNKKLTEERYPDKIKEIKEKIYDLEIAKFGESEVLESSPNASNSFL